MKTIMVFDVPASMGGALTILNSFYDFAKKCRDINWIFVVSISSLSEQENIRVLCFEWVKKNWIRRLAFDCFYAPKIVKEYKPDTIVSLQNTCIHGAGIRQVLYLHQPVPFSNINYKLSESPVLWTYKNVISKIIYRSVKKSDAVVVQTKWMKNAVAEKTGVGKEKIHIIPPDYKLVSNATYTDSSSSRVLFFYPVAPNSYKNHKVIIDAVRFLLSNGVSGFKVLFTCDPIESVDGRNISDLKQIECIGRKTIESVYSIMAESTLIFPSKLETFGLPLLEAACVKSRIIAGNMPFSHEILDGYPNVTFFNVDDAQELANIMQQIISGKIPYIKEINTWKYLNNKNLGWHEMEQLL